MPKKQTPPGRGKKEDRRGRRRSGGGFGVGYLVGESFMKRKAESVAFSKY